MTSYDYYQQLFQELPGYQPAGFEPPVSDMDMFTGAFQQMQKQEVAPAPAAPAPKKAKPEITTGTYKGGGGVRRVTLSTMKNASLTPENIQRIQQIAQLSGGDEQLESAASALQQYSLQEDYQALAKEYQQAQKQYGPSAYSEVGDAYGSSFGTVGELFQGW